MKTAISLPDEVFESAENLARKLRLTRSKLYATAVAEFVARHKMSRVTERLNAVYATVDSNLDAFGRKASDEALRRSEW